MSRAIVLIDGFNLYHAINANPSWNIYKWLDYTKLAKSFLPKTDEIKEILYFTALSTWMPQKVERHKKFILANELQGITVVYGMFKVRDKFCTRCNSTYKAHEEKQTDVNIAIHLFKRAVDDVYDKAYVISGDSDLVPAIKMVKLTFPNKLIGVVIPIGRSAEELKQSSDFHMKMKLKHLISSRFPNDIPLPGSGVLSCPPEWMPSTT